MKKYLGLLNLAMIFVLVAGILSSCAAKPAFKGIFTIAVAEADPGSENNPAPHSLYAGARMAAEQLNAQGGVNGYSVEMAPYADKKDPQQAGLNAQAIVNSNAIAVIGHSTSATTQSAAPFYRKANLLAINASPVTSATFEKFPEYYDISYSSEQQGAYLADYAIQNLGYDKAMVVYENESSTSALAQKFEHTFHGLGGGIVLSQAIDAAASDKDIEEVVSSVFSSNNGVLFIAAGEEVSADIVIALKNRGFQNPIIGGDNLSSRTFIDKIQCEGAEQARPGYFTDGILTTRALLPDSASGFANRYVMDYQKMYPNIPVSNSAARGYDAALAIFKAIQIAQSKTEAAPDRQKIDEAMGELNDPKTTFYGVTGPIYFGSDHHAVRQTLLGVYEYGYLISAPAQYQPVLIPEKIPDFQDQLKNGHIVTLDGDYMYRTHVIYTGMDMIAVKELDQKASTYTADFYLWFRFRPDKDDPEFQPENIVFTNADSIESKDVVRDETTADGSVYKTLRVSGTFKNQLKFQAYPFDRQDLDIQFRNQNATATFIQYVIDRPGMRYINDHELLNDLVNHGVFDSLYGWVPKFVHADQSLFSTTSTLGDPKNFDNTTTTDFSVFDIHMRIQRNSLEFIIKSLLPLLITLILAYISFFLPLGHSERFGIGSTALLTTALFHLSLAGELPEIGYTVAIEYFFYAAYLMSALIVLLETLSIRLEQKASEVESENIKAECESRRRKLNVIGRIAYPSILATVLVLGGLAYAGMIDLNINTEVERRAVQDIGQSHIVSSNQPGEATASPSAGDAITLRLATWRPEDDAQIKSLLQAFHEKNPGITILHQPISGDGYDKVLAIQFANQVGPDMFFVRPFNRSYSAYAADVSALPIEENFKESLRIPWRDTTGAYYAAPYVGVIQGVYYNKDIFNKLNLSVPATWEQFLGVVDVIKKAGYVPIGNSLVQGEEDDMFMTLAPNFINGAQGRNAYMQPDGKGRCFNDPFAVRAFHSVQEIVPYMSQDFNHISSYTSKERFINQQVAILFGGSWDLHYFSDNAKFNWGVFASPAPQGSQTTVIFQPDIGIGVNNQITAAKKEAVMGFLQWLMTKESLDLTNEILPGFYPLNNMKTKQSSNIHSAGFQQLVQDYPTDLRWAHSELEATGQHPSAAELITSSLYDVVANNLDPQVAADRLQAGMAQWYEPAQTCSK